MAADFEWPAFHSYPPYFTLQPVAETRAKQSALWRDLILAYCRAKRVWSVTADGGDKDELFCNKAIDRSLPADTRAAFIADAVAAGQATWLDNDTTHRRALVLWRPLAEWADVLAGWARDGGHSGAVLTLDELAAPDSELAGTDLVGAPPALLLAVAKQLEKGGRAAVFGGGGEDVGIKFL